MNINEISQKLGNAGIEEPLFEARLLCGHFLSLSMTELVLLSKTDLDNFPGYKELSQAVEKRCTRYPLQYILGEWEFYGLKFKVNEKCLIPRPDTEVVTERAIEVLSGVNSSKKTFADLCTGSGCIAAAVLHEVPDSYAVCVDIDRDTADIARINLERNNVIDRAEIIVGDAASDLFDDETKFDLVVSNPPYIAEVEMAKLEPELAYEPRIALTDGGDGLSLIRDIVRVYKNHLNENGKIILEHGYRQSEAVREIATDNGMTFEPIYDYGKRTRGAVLGLILQ